VIVPPAPTDTFNAPTLYSRLAAVFGVAVLLMIAISVTTMVLAVPFVHWTEPLIDAVLPSPAAAAVVAQETVPVMAASPRSVL